jgi:hypothetical protein
MSLCGGPLRAHHDWIVRFATGNPGIQPTITADGAVHRVSVNVFTKRRKNTCPDTPFSVPLCTAGDKMGKEFIDFRVYHKWLGHEVNRHIPLGR